MSFQVYAPITVRFRDLDALGHVNNAVYLTYLEMSRFVYFTAPGIDLSSPSMLVARVEIDYRRPILLNQEVFVAVRTSRIGTKSFTLDYEIRADDVVAAQARSVQAWFDFTQQMSIAIPQDVRERLEAFDGPFDQAAQPTNKDG